MLVDDHASVRSAGAQSKPEGVACPRSAYVTGKWASGSPSWPNSARCLFADLCAGTHVHLGLLRAARGFAEPSGLSPPASLPNLPFRSEACPHIGGEHRFTIMEGATPTFMPDCAVVVIAGWCGKTLDQRGLLGLQNLCWRPPRT